MKISFHGAARSVTGERLHFIHTGTFSLLLGYSKFQERREQAAKLYRQLGFDSISLTAVCLSHAHIDHSGALPVLAKEDFCGLVQGTRRASS